MANSEAGHLLWLIIAVSCQFLWGIYPAAVRYLQTKAEVPLTSLQLSFLINVLACPALFLGNTLPLWIASGCRRARAKRQQRKAAKAAKTGAQAGDSALAEPLLEAAEDGQAAGEPDLESSAAAAAAPTSLAEADVPAGRVSWRRQAVVLLLTTSFLSTLFLSQVFSLLFTTAYLSQMVFLLAPVIVAFMAKALFNSPLPKGLWPALLLMLLGCGMVIGSKAAAAGKPPKNAVDAAAPIRTSLWASQGEEAWLCAAVLGEQHGRWLCGLADADAGSQEGAVPDTSAASQQHSGLGKKKKKHDKHAGGLGARDLLGIGLSFLGAVCLAAFMTVVQRSHGAVSDQQVLWANFLTQAPACLALTYLLERSRFPALLHLPLSELGEVFAMAAGVNWFANWVQQMCIRNLGAPQAAAFLPVRLLGSLAASYPLLGESLQGPWQWGGAALLLGAVTWYLLQQKAAAEGGSRSTGDLLRAEAAGQVAYVA